MPVSFFCWALFFRNCKQVGWIFKSMLKIYFYSSPLFVFMTVRRAFLISE